MLLFPNLITKTIMRIKKSQVAVEYLIMLGVILFLFSIVWGKVNQVAESTRINVRVSNAEAYLEKLKTNIDLVNFYGEPTKIEIIVYVPDGVNFVNLVNNQIILGVQTSAGETIMGVKTRANLTGSLPHKRGTYTVFIKASGEFVNLSY